MICKIQCAIYGIAVIFRQIQERISRILNAIRGVQDKHAGKQDALPILLNGRASVLIALTRVLLRSG